MKIKYARGSYFRKPEYRTFTRIEEVNDSLVVRKFPVTEVALSHVQSFYEKTSIVEDAFGLKTPKVLKKSEKYFEYEYLSIPTMEQLIERAVIFQNFSKALTLVEKLLSLINDLPSIESNIYQDNDFSQVFDPDNVFNSGKGERCVYPGLIDINADNILVDEAGGYILIDYEWLYSFPIPRQFIVFRSLFYLASHLQSVIQTMCSPQFPCTQVIDEILVPTQWLKLMSCDKKDIYRFLSYEIQFQNNVLVLNMAKLKKSDVLLKESVEVISKIKAEESKLERENKVLKRYAQDLEATLNEVKGTKFYKASKLVERLKRVSGE